MKFVQKLLLVLGIAMVFIAPAQAKIPIFYSFGGEKAAKVMDFPQTPDFQISGGKHFDGGVEFKQISLFFIPLWNYDEKWCGFIDDTHVIRASREELAEVAKSAGITLPENPTLPFWDRFGGKIIFGALALLLIWGSIGGKKEEPEAEKQE